MTHCHRSTVVLGAHHRSGIWEETANASGPLFECAASIFTL